MTRFFVLEKSFQWARGALMRKVKAGILKTPSAMAPATVLKRVVTQMKTMAMRTEGRRRLGGMSVRRFDPIRSLIRSEVWKWSWKKVRKQDVTRVRSWVDSEVFVE